jgi:hypothetical protein
MGKLIEETILKRRNMFEEILSHKENANQN